MNDFRENPEKEKGKEKNLTRYLVFQQRDSQRKYSHGLKTM